MNKIDIKNKKALAVQPNTADYEIGYGKPPEITRFKPGQSGNPSGRPKGSRNRPKPLALNEERLKDIILAEAYRAISVNDTSGQITMPMAQAVIRSMAVNAAKGNQRAQNLFTQLISSTEKSNKLLYDEYLETAIQYKVDWEKVLEHRKQTGATGTEPIPHPDDIEIDFQTGQVRINGPMTKEEKAVLDDLYARKQEFIASIAEDEKLLHDNPDHEHKQFILDEINHSKKMLDLFVRKLPSKR